MSAFVFLMAYTQFGNHDSKVLKENYYSVIFYLVLGIRR